MVYGSILDRSFSKVQRKRVVYGVFLVCLIISWNICAVFNPDLNSIQTLNLKLSLGVGLNNTLMTEESSNPNQYEKQRSLAKITGTSSSLQVQTENSKAVPYISELTSTNNSKQKSTHVREENTKVIPNFSQPNSTNVKAEEYNPNQPISRPNSKGILIPSVTGTSKAQAQAEKLEPICSTSHPRTDVCEISGDVRIDSKASTILLALPNATLLPIISSWSIRPYARKNEKTAMDHVRKFQVKMINSQYQSSPNCTQKHRVVGIVFSTSGYSRNHFHAYVDILVPLYLTSREFDGEVKFLVTNHDPRWINKYIAILQKLSKYELIDIDKEDGVHCFPRMTVGLKLHKEFKIDPSISKNSMADFRNLLREAYSLKRQTAIKLSAQQEDKIPRLLIISRRRTRSFLNEDEIMNMSRNLGFEVIIAEADPNEAKFARIVNSCDVMMGVHGAGLTNIVFLPERAVFIQIVPLGEMDWIAKTTFGEPAKSMNLSYLEYKIGENESSLIQQYPLNHPVLGDPLSISKKGWNAFKEVYLVRQNVKLDASRFRRTLLQALELLHK